MSEPWTTADRREVGGAEEDVEDRLGAEVRDGGAAHVLDVDRGVGEGRAELGGGVAELLRPLGSRVEEEDGSHRSARIVRERLCGVHIGEGPVEPAGPRDSGAPLSAAVSAIAHIDGQTGDSPSG